MQGVALPAPKHQYSRPNEIETENINTAPARHSTVPPYLQRETFVPYHVEDFGDGGSFPEIHVVQYPLNMGRPGVKSTAVVAVDVDEKGEVRYDAIVKQGGNRNKMIQSSLDDIKEKDADEDLTALPQESEEAETANKTRIALEALLNGKIKQAKPTSAVAVKEQEEPTYIRYTPNPGATGVNGAAQSRVIRMVEAQVDPMEPAKHVLKKVPRGPPSPPVPVLHSPPRKVTVADQQAWKVPPCISNWKNAKGYTIPLDKRLAADGRGLQDATINNKFASLTEALYVAERKASEDLRIRDQIRKKLAVKEKEDKERELREMATKARMERAGVLQSSAPADEVGSRAHVDIEDLDSLDGSERGRSRSRSPVSRHGRGRSRSRSSDEGSGRDMRSRPQYHRGEEAEGDDRRRSASRRSRSGESAERPRGSESEAERVARVQREKLRIDRRKERERELRLENIKGARKNKVDRDANRDVSEKIALNMHKGSGKLSGEAMYDSRLFNQSAGMDAGFGAEDEYTTYSKPLFDRGEASTVYRPKRDDSEVYGDADAQMAKLSDTSRFKADKGFKGAEGGGQKGGRDAPVQFERERAEDPFGISDLVGHRDKRARHDDDDE